MNVRELLRITGIPVVAASLCCLSPAIFVLLGLSTASAAAGLADTLYGEYKWVFRTMGLVLLFASMILALRKKGICTLDQAKRKRNEIINLLLISLTAGILGYVFFLYVIVHYLGVWLNIWQ